ncbi:hypothetical protein EG68_06504 [Paragonimus skrjabini miyazakii]|uniref:Uncharacterized protein n=1 Tax=Paragonimus skrjabini miyazakii TaxID=59628 RepID=A0A8S9YY84_9TREM|nr:hypothetical protein EG68_06504 [Paragonimus skrjabini miyazakii]
MNHIHSIIHSVPTKRLNGLHTKLQSFIPAEKYFLMSYIRCHTRLFSTLNCRWSSKNGMRRAAASTSPILNICHVLDISAITEAPQIYLEGRLDEMAKRESRYGCYSHFLGVWAFDGIPIQNI